MILNDDLFKEEIILENNLIITSPPYADQRKETYGVFIQISILSGFCQFQNKVKIE